jgi:hypothetical protein
MRATVNPVQTTTYYLTSGNNPITFGTGTSIDVSSGSGIGVYGSNVQSWAVTNRRAISGHLYGVDLTAGGSVTNKAGATISGGHESFYGGSVRIAGGAGTVTNAGAINSSGRYGVELTGGGSVTNDAGATIRGQYSFGPGIGIAGGEGTVTNAGDISGFLYGVELQAGGSVTNKAGGTISGGFAGVYLTAGGAVTNKAGGAIDSDYVGIRAKGVAASVTNAGSIRGSEMGPFSGVGLYAGGSVVNAAGATISASYGVYINGGAGTVTNAGDIRGVGNFRGSNRGVGVDFYAGGSLTNQGTGAISGYNAGVFFLAGGPGTVTNAGIVTNAGAISGHKLGVFALRSAATVTNTGDISGEGGLVTMGSAATVTNSGTIAGTKVGSTFFFVPITLGDGVFMNAGGAVTNKAGGTITGAGDGVYIAGGGSVINAGTISGTTASVQFAGAGANTLTLKTGSRLIGDAIGSTTSGATNALVLQGSGTANNNFDNFNTLFVRSGANWTLGGTSAFGGATISSGALLKDAGALRLTGTSALAGSKIIIASDDLLTMDGTTSLSGKVLGPGTLAFTGGSATLNSGASLSVARWAVSGSGTAVTLDENLTYAGSFSEGTGDTFVLSGGCLLLEGADTFTGGTVDGSNILKTRGTTTVSGLTIGGTVEWENDGTVTQSGGSTTLGDASGGTAFLDNRSRGTYDITDDSGIGLGRSTASHIQNAGLFEKTGGTGTSVIAPAVTNTGTVEVTAGTLDLQGAVTGRGTDKVSGASTLEFDSTVAATQTVKFLGGASTVDLTDPNGFFGKIAGFASLDAVQLSGDWDFSSFSENAAGTLGTLTLANDASHHAFDFVGDYTASDFKIASGATTTIGHT